MQLSSVPISILDLAPYAEGKNPADAYRATLDLAQRAEQWGYRRYWIAEHHNIEGISSAATTILMSYVADHTERIRVGSGGIMLPNHAPLVIAEQFGTLAALYPGRIDMGLGRAPGADRHTMMAMRRESGGRAAEFPELIEELLSYLAPAEPGQRLKAIPGAGTELPVWILGSSLYSAELAALLGRPYAFASHFAPGSMRQALALYREQFRPSPWLAKPYVMVGVPVVAADSDERAEFLATTLYQAFLNIVRNARRPAQAPVEKMEWSNEERGAVQSALHEVVVGGPEKVRRGLENFLALTKADELIVPSSFFHHEDRLRSYEILAGLAGLGGRG